MAYSSPSTKRIKEQYLSKRADAAERSERRKREVEAAIPALAAIDRELSLLGMKVFGAALSGGDIDYKINGLKAEQERLTAERARLLTEHGYPADYTDIVYECDICGDTGFVGTKMCSCMKNAIALAEYEESGIANLMAEQSFDSFKLDYYTGVEKEAMARNLSILRSYAESFSSKTTDSWLLFGGTGLGKTHLSTSVAKVVIDRGFHVVYDSIQSVIAAFETQRFGDGTPGDGMTDKYFDCDLLILDDLGTEMTNQFTLACLYNIINSRIIKRKPVIASTNLSQSELRSRYSDRITSRLFGEYRPLVFMGKDIRAQKLLK